MMILITMAKKNANILIVDNSFNVTLYTTGNAKIYNLHVHVMFIVPARKSRPLCTILSHLERAMRTPDCGLRRWYKQ